MVFERNLNGIEVILRIDNYESPSKHTFGDWWCVNRPRLCGQHKKAPE